MIELNEKITSDTVIEIFANIVLKEAINHRHRDIGLVTMYQIVSHPIDGIYTSITLQVSDERYPPFIIIPSDYLLRWLKINFDSTFGAKMDTLVPHTEQRLNFQKPDTVKRFI